MVKAEHTELGANTRFVVTNLDMADDPPGLYDGMYCVGGETYRWQRLATWSNHLVDRTTALCILIHNKEQVLERNSGKLIRMLQQDGWKHVATKGSHWQFRHPAKPGRVTIPHPSKDVPRGTVASIYRQAGWSA